MRQVLPESVRGALRLADRQLWLRPADDVNGMCAVIRRAANAIAPVDTFYVGLYRDDNMLVMPYIFSAGEHLGADTSRFGLGSVSEWIRSRAVPYRYGLDGGRRCHAGAPVGDGVPSRDIVAVPMFDADGRTVIGMVNTQSPHPDVFDDTFVVALEWLAQALSLALNERARSAARDRLYLDFPELDSGRLDSPVDMLHASTDRLDEVARQIEAAQSRAAQWDPAELDAELGRIKDQCREFGSELAMLALRAPVAPGREVQDALTAREREIADLIVDESLTNAMIGRRLFISEKTVKAHVSRILRKLGIRQRSELVWLLGGKSTVRPDATQLSETD